MRETIEECRRICGPAPRSVGLLDYFRFNLAPPRWMATQPKDPLTCVYREQRRLRSEGQIVWAAMVQANNLLFAPGADDCPADCLFSLDPYFDERVGELRIIARSLFELKSTTHSEPEIQRFVDHITDEYVRAFNLPFPTSLTCGRVVYFTTIMVQRAYLPGGYLARRIFPMFVRPDQMTASLIVPSRQWPETLRADWLSDRVTEPADPDA